MSEPFSPILLLRNHHLQTTLTSLRPRTLLARCRAADLRRKSRELVIDCGQGTRLLGDVTIHREQPRGLVTLIHGWEGSIDSAYILSAAAYLHKQGYSIFRLNLRDHGKSHHLNRDFFISTRLDEVIAAIGYIQAAYPHQRNYLVGFSLGGNFALRIAMAAPHANLDLTRVATICPLIDPADATGAIERHHPVYHYYFVRKWKRSLAKKLALFPDLDDPASLLSCNTLSSLHGYFVPRHTPYQTTADYFHAYRIDAEQLNQLRIPTWIIAADDDPIIRSHTIDRLQPNKYLHLERQSYGGHCGFLRNLKLESWADERLAELFTDRQ
jgi:predicted alpha/beta-fold hydrolase